MTGHGTSAAGAFSRHPRPLRTATPHGSQDTHSPTDAQQLAEADVGVLSGPRRSTGLRPLATRSTRKRRRHRRAQPSERARKRWCRLKAFTVQVGDTGGTFEPPDNVLSFRPHQKHIVILSSHLAQMCCTIALSPMARKVGGRAATSNGNEE